MNFPPPSTRQRFWHYYTCTVGLNNEVKEWQVVGAGVSLLECEFADKCGEKARMTHVVMD